MSYIIFLSLIFVVVNFKLYLFFDFFRWKVIDLYRFYKNPRKIHLFGIWCFVGIYGGGKTMSLVHYLESIRKKYGDKVYISTNFYYKNEDFHIDTWKDLLVDYDRPIIFAYDELQNDFNSREYKSFPTSLMVLLTQNRKGNGKQIVYTTQDYETVDKNFRRLTRTIVSCRTLAGRLTRCRYFDREDYEHYISTVSVERKMKIKSFNSYMFIQTDYLRDLYDSFKMLESAKLKQYSDRV